MEPRRERAPRLGEAFPSLLVAAQSGGSWAFQSLYRTLAPPVAGYLRLQGADDPDDLTNEVFLNVFSAIGSFSGDEPQFRSWVFTIAHRRLVDERRRGGRRPQISYGESAEAVDSGGDVEDEILRRLSVERVRNLCDRLAPDQRDVLLLRLVSAMTVDEAAEALGKSPTAVKALQRRGLGAIRRLFEREGVSR
ncbi:MAG: RNA polymerase sigma factor [Acidimicrobiales bacterium]